VLNRVNLNSWEYKTTNHYFDYLDFHDCCVEEIKVEKDMAIFEFEFVYISKIHPLNPYKVAKATDRCKLTFKGVTMIKLIIHFDDGIDKEVPIVELEEMEFLTFSQSSIRNNFIFEMFGTDWKTKQFCSIKLKANNFTLEWNRFTEDAWYV